MAVLTRPPLAIFWRALLSETYKFVTLRSQVVLLASLVCLPLIVATVRLNLSPVGHTDSASLEAWALDSLAMVVMPAGFAAAFAGLSSLAGEYAGGAVRISRLAVPDLRKIIMAKALVVFALIGVATSLGFALAALLVQANLPFGLSPKALDSLGWLVLNATLVCALLAVMAVGVAFFAHSLVGAGLHLAIVLAVLPPIVGGFSMVFNASNTDWFAISGLQAATTFGQGHPFVLQGVALSRLDSIQGLLVVATWALGYLFAAVVLCGVEFALLKRAVDWVSRSLGAGNTLRSDSHPRLANGAAPKPARGSSLWRLVLSEVYKLASIRGTWIFIAIALGIDVAQGLVTATSITAAEVQQGATYTQDMHDLDNWLFHTQVLSSGVGASQLIFAFFGLFAFLGDKNSGMILVSSLAAPSRIKLWFAKVLTVAFWALSLGFVAQVVVALTTIEPEAAGGWAFNLFIQPALQTSMVNIWVLSLCAVIGFSIAVVARGAIGAYVTVLAIFVVVPSILTSQYGLTRNAISAWFFNLYNLMPSAQNAVQWVSPWQHGQTTLESGLIQLWPWQAQLVIVAWAAGLAFLALLRFRRGSLAP